VRTFSYSQNLSPVKTSVRYPDYPRDRDGHIPEHLCFDVIRVRADFLIGYLWDMNGASISVSDITGAEEEELDHDFENWADRYNSLPVDESHDQIWESDDERRVFDQDGARLSKTLYDYLQRKNTVVYRPTNGDETRFDAIGKTPVRLHD